jgi:hypothetical protein
MACMDGKKILFASSYIFAKIRSCTFNIEVYTSPYDDVTDENSYCLMKKCYQRHIMPFEYSKRLIKFDYNLVLWLGNLKIGGRLFLRILGIRPVREMKQTNRC